MNRSEKIEYIQMLEEQVKRNKQNRLNRTYESFYDWQQEFNAATKHNQACLLMAANQVGKSRTGCTIDAYHLLGEYPIDWQGRKFESPPMCWLLGYSGEKTRDLLQNKLFGRYVENKFEGGLIPAERIVDHRAMTGTAGAMREVRVKHKNGISTCQFWSYSQGQHALMGDKVDWYHIDEEPKDSDIFPQVITRTINGDNGRGGAGILTFTPENGMTQLVCQFMGESYEGEEESKEVNLKGQYIQTATWDDAPHITPEMREIILSMYPAYQKKMRSKGVPLMGSGLIYPYDEDSIKCDPFEVPDYWFVINGMDFGWDHPQAHVQLVWDRDADNFYLINAYKKSKMQPFAAYHAVKPWAENVPTAWPADGLKTMQTSKGNDEVQLKSIYEQDGFNMLPEHATWEDGGNGVWVGIMEICQLIEQERFKVVSTLTDWFAEFRQYHTKTTAGGKTEIVKVKDDLLDATRYAYMMRRFAIRVCDLYPEQYNQHVNKDTGQDRMAGY